MRRHPGRSTPLARMRLCCHKAAGRQNGSRRTLCLACTHGLGHRVPVRSHAHLSQQRLQPHGSARRSGGLRHEDGCSLRRSCLSCLHGKKRPATPLLPLLLHRLDVGTAHSQQLVHSLLLAKRRTRRVHRGRRSCLATESLAAEHLRTEASPAGNTCLSATGRANGRAHLFVDNRGGWGYSDFIRFSVGRRGLF